MADSHLKMDRDQLLTVLAQKIGCERQYVEFLFDSSSDNTEDLEIPKFNQIKPARLSNLYPV